jgi:hypothetical protein
MSLRRVAKDRFSLRVLRCFGGLGPKNDKGIEADSSFISGSIVITDYIVKKKIKFFKKNQPIVDLIMMMSRCSGSGFQLCLRFLAAERIYPYNHGG